MRGWMLLVMLACCVPAFGQGLVVSNVMAAQGPNIAPGVGKHIVWDIAADLPNEKVPRAKVRVHADDGVGEGEGEGETIMLPGNVPLEMVRIPAGTFMMGGYPGEQDSNSSEGPQHQVTLTQAFWLGKYVVTKRQWTAVMGATPWSGKQCVLNDLDSPAVDISWNDCQAFVTTVNALGKGTFRFPTEAEWEYACRAGTTTQFYWGNDPTTYSQIGNYAWYKGNSLNAGQQYAHIVGKKLPNAWGLYDMSGNVLEWCQDYWHGDYTGAPTNGSAWEIPTSSARVIRGGGWSIDAARSAFRIRIDPSYGLNIIGFRLALVR